MGKRAIPVGGFGWEELQSKDLKQAVPFYEKLLGWSSQVFPMEYENYHVFMLGKSGMGGAAAHQAKHTGDFCHWLCYIMVEDVDAAAAKVKQLGGSIVLPPHDIPDVGRSALIRDPEGSYLSIIRFTDEEVFAPEDPVGSFCWRELVCRDPEQAKRFYTGLFAWETSSMEMGEQGTYTIWKVGEQMVGGMMQLSEDWGDAPAHWMPYVAVADVDVSYDKAKELGGTSCVPPTDIPGMGRFCVINDPAGGTLSLYMDAPS